MTEPTPITILHISDIQFGHKHQFGRLALGDLDAAFDTLLERLTLDADRDEARDLGGMRSRARTDFFSHVADVCRLREPDEARVVEQRDDESGIPYLRVPCRSGLVTRSCCTNWRGRCPSGCRT